MFNIEATNKRQVHYNFNSESRTRGFFKCYEIQIYGSVSLEEFAKKMTYIAYLDSFSPLYDRYGEINTEVLSEEEVWSCGEYTINGTGLSTQEVYTIDYAGMRRVKISFVFKEDRLYLLIHKEYDKEIKKNKEHWSLSLGYENLIIETIESFKEDIDVSYKVVQSIVGPHLVSGNFFKPEHLAYGK